MLPVVVVVVFFSPPPALSRISPVRRNGSPVFLSPSDLTAVCPIPRRSFRSLVPVKQGTRHCGGKGLKRGERQCLCAFSSRFPHLIPVFRRKAQTHWMREAGRAAHLYHRHSTPSFTTCSSFNVPCFSSPSVSCRASKLSDAKGGIISLKIKSCASYFALLFLLSFSLSSSCFAMRN